MKKTFWIYKHTEHSERVEAGPYATWDDAKKARDAHARACPHSEPSEPIEVFSDYVIDRG